MDEKNNKEVLIIGNEETKRKNPFYPKELCFTVGKSVSTDFGKGKDWWIIDFWYELDEFLGDKKFKMVYIDIGSDGWLLDKEQDPTKFKHLSLSKLHEEVFIRNIFDEFIKTLPRRLDYNTIPVILMNKKKIHPFKQMLIDYCNRVFDKMMDVLTKHLDDKYGIFLIYNKGGDKFYNNVISSLTEKNFLKLNNPVKIYTDIHQGDFKEEYELDFIIKNSESKDVINDKIGIFKKEYTGDIHISSIFKYFSSLNFGFGKKSKKKKLVKKSKKSKKKLVKKSKKSKKKLVKKSKKSKKF